MRAVYMSDLVDYLIAKRPTSLSGYGPATTWQVSRMAFLCEWRAALVLGRTLTDAKWVRGMFAPRSDALDCALEPDDRLTLGPTMGDYDRRAVYLTGRVPTLPAEAAKVADFVLGVCETKDALSFARMFQSCAPVYWSNRGEPIDLVEWAEGVKADWAAIAEAAA